MPFSPFILFVGLAYLSNVYVYSHTLDEIFACVNDAARHFLHYLPHSGWSNQVNALVNALMLAAILNRTLVLPPALLGHKAVVPWRPFDKLNYTLSKILSIKTQSYDDGLVLLKFAEIFPNITNIQDIHVISYDRFSALLPSVSRAHALKDHVRYVATTKNPNTNDRFLCFEDRDDGTTIMSSKAPYQPTEKYPISLYVGYQLPSDAHVFNSSVLYVGSLFGHEKVFFDNLYYNATKFLMLKNNVLQATASLFVPCFDQSIVPGLSMLKDRVYYSFHLRGSFPFSNKTLLTTFLAIEIFLKQNTTRHALENCIKGNLGDASCLYFSRALLLNKSATEIIPLYVATDMKDFPKTIEFQLLSRSFKSVLTLDDILADTSRSSIENCLMEKNISAPFLYPLYDQIISSRSLFFVGTKGSTFSYLIRRMHQAAVELNV